MNATHKKNSKTNSYSESWDVINQIHDYGIDVINKELFLFPREEYIYGGGEDPPECPGVEFGMANQFIRNLRVLSSLTEDPILIHMKTCGGYWEEGLAMYEAIRACPNSVIILNYASARSMSSLIFLAADKRVMMPHSTFMFHTGTASLYGHGTLIDTDYEQLKKDEQLMISIYVKSLRESDAMSGWSDKKIGNWVRREMKKKEDVYFSAEKAVEYNFADTIFGEDGDYDWASLKDVS